MRTVASLVVAVVVLLSLTVDAVSEEIYLPLVRFTNSDEPASTPTATATTQATATQTNVVEETSTATSTSTSTGTPQNTSTPTATGTHTQTPTSTSTPTSTGTATNTPTTTPTPSETPTEVPVLGILDNHSTYTTVLDSLYIVGEVQNNSASNIRFVRVNADLFNSNQSLVDTDFGYTYLDVLPPGTKTCFAVLFFDAPEHWSTYRLSGTFLAGGEYAPNLVLFDVSITEDTFGYPKILGQVRNDGSETARYVQLVATLYNSAGTVIDCDFTYVNSTHLSPGQTSSFEFSYFSDHTKNYSSYRVQVQGSLP
jgi:hypothetical protein